MMIVLPLIIAQINVLVIAQLGIRSATVVLDDELET